MLLGAFVCAQRATRGACDAKDVTHEIFSPNHYPAPLTAQVMREIPTAVQQAKERRLPFEPPDKVNREYLNWEFDENRRFLNKELKKDPRLKPNDVEVSIDHMSTCTSCSNYEGLHQALHPQGTIDIGKARQLLVDDWPIHSWQNVVRFLNPPDERIPVLDAQDDKDARFGCPCSIMQTQSPGVPLESGGTPDGGIHPEHRSLFRT